ncbi:MAG TPA: hypothetical protein EYH26_00435 [Pyrodictium sp.]|nr:hypothetical protein [Pyrodictium sp.]
MNWDSQVVDLYMVIVLLSLTASLAYMLVQTYLRKTKKIEVQRIVSVIECCGKRFTRKFSRGDYVGKEVECSECEEKGRIVAIFVEKIEANKRRKAYEPHP